MDEISIQAFFKFKKTEPAEISKRTRVCIHCSFRKQKCRLKSTTTNGCRHFGQSEQRKSSVLFPIQSEKSPDSGFFTCDPTKKCIMPSSRERHKGIIGRGMISGQKLRGHVCFNFCEDVARILKLSPYQCSGCARPIFSKQPP